VAEKRGIVSDSGAVRLEATRSFAEVHEADIVVVGGSVHALIPRSTRSSPGCAICTRARSGRPRCRSLLPRQPGC
jgi:hypothetical protein